MKEGGDDDLSLRKDRWEAKLPVNENGEVDFSPQRKFVVTRTGRQIARMQRNIKVTAIVCAILALLVLILYFLFNFINRGGEGDIDRGDFTVEVFRGERAMFSLSESEDLSNPTIMLQGSSVDDLWHCTRSWIPASVDENSKGGDASSEDPSYFCYTFYLTNASDKDFTYRYDLDFVEKYLDLDDACRIMIYRNGEEKVYAKAPIEGTPLEAGTEEFLNDKTYVAQTDLTLEKGGTDKYTIVIWLEGEDPECVNDVLTGKLKLEMNFYTEDNFQY